MVTHPASRFLHKTTQPSMFTLMLLASISALAMNSFLPTLENMAQHFKTSTSVMGLSVGIYLGTSAIFQLFAGPLSDNIGRRPVLLWALFIFILSSIGAIYAPSTATFMLMRAIQAASACAMVLARAVVRDTTSTEESSSKIAYISLGMAVAPMIGPAIGGYLGGHFGWEANFWMIVCLGLVTWFVVYFDHGETSPMHKKSFWQQFTVYPELLTSLRFWGYCLASAFAAGTFFAFLGGGTFVGSVVYNLTPQELGLFFALPAFGFLIGTLIAGKYSTKLGVNKMIYLGLFILFSTLTTALICSHLNYDSATIFVGFMTLVGLGNGICMPNASAGMLAVRPHLAGTASGLGGSMMIAFGALLSTFAGALLSAESTEMPLLFMMWFLSMCALCIMLLVRKRNSFLGTNF